MVAIPVMLLVVGIVLVSSCRHFRTMQIKIDRINLVLREQINGVRVIRAFVRNVFRGENVSVTPTEELDRERHYGSTGSSRSPCLR